MRQVETFERASALVRARACADVAGCCHINISGQRPSFKANPQGVSSFSMSVTEQPLKSTVPSSLPSSPSGLYVFHREPQNQKLRNINLLSMVTVWVRDPLPWRTGIPSLPIECVARYRTKQHSQRMAISLDAPILICDPVMYMCHQTTLASLLVVLCPLIHVNDEVHVPQPFT